MDNIRFDDIDDGDIDPRTVVVAPDAAKELVRLAKIQMDEEDARTNTKD